MNTLSKPGQYVWFKPDDTSRNPYAAFRRSFEIADVKKVKSAEFYIFADTVYSLYVNGQFVGFGPVRFDPRYPQYDCYDLAGYLQDGKNVIAVLANFHGHKVFKSIPAQAAMVAWGQVDTGSGVIDLRTGTAWKCRQHLSYSRYTPKLSFALFAQEHYDQGLFDEDWICPGYDDSQWPVAVEISNQNAFGPLTPREIPFMKLSHVTPHSVTVAPLIKTEDLYSLYFPVSMRYDAIGDEKAVFSRFICWSTYIYSPRRQTVTAGVLYERLWVNGKPCQTMEDPIRPLRFNALVELDEGWNYLFVHVDAHIDIYDGYLALPSGKGLVVSADKNENSDLLFKYLSLQKIELDKQLRDLPLPLPEDFDMAAFGGWAFSTKADSAASPCREASWDMYAPPIETIPQTTNNSIIRKDLYPDGFMLTFDMEYMRLVFPRLQLQGVKGATIDFLYSDRFAADGQHLRALSWVPLGDRVVCANDTLDWQPIQPRGFRLLGITVRNAPGDVPVKDISFLSAHYPTEQVGYFECSDPLLNKIWEMGAISQAVNMEDAYVDCVDRERGIYALDALIQYHVNLACFGDHPLMKRTLEIYGQSSHETGAFRCLYPNTGDYIIPDFCLYVVNGFYAYYRQTKDIALVEKYWREIIDNLQVFHKLSDERQDKLLCGDNPTEGWGNRTNNLTGFFGDGARTENTGINSLFSSLYLQTLRETLEMGEAINTNDVAEDMADLKQRIAVLEKSIQDAFWNEEKGLFADTIEHKRFSPHASIFALLAGVITPQQRERLRQTIPPLCSCVFTNGYDHTGGTLFELNIGFLVIKGLYELGLDNVAERCIKDAWGYFIVNGLKTTPEHFDLQASRCHAWAAYPTYMLSRYVLGVQFDALGDVTVYPQPGHVTWAKGAFPHPKGLVEVEWHKENGQIIFDRLTTH
ncbi:MAG: alpha-L-rhamnosidase N-terminal domain-containing protein [Firmicutes bacterium]|nr:alpha-L-rhamnosidase N-terminal domain-containing protein [Bacillota bacterium]